MAIRTISTTGGNWNSTSTWDEGVVPTLSDDVVARGDGTSGSVIITGSSSCKSIVLTNYVNTLTFNNSLNVYGNVTFVSGMSLSGTSQLRLNTSGTLTSGGLLFPGELAFFGTSQTYNLGDNWTVNGQISCSGTTSLTLSGNQVTTLSNFNIGSAGVQGTTTVVMGGNGTIQGTGFMRNNLTINSYGTVNIGQVGSTTLNYNTGTLRYLSGVTVTTGSTLSIAASTTLNTSGMSWNDITMVGTSTINLTSNLKINRNLTTQTGVVTINSTGSTVYVSGNLTINTTTSGTAPIIMDGTGSWTSNGSNLTNNLTFNTTGTTYVSGNVYYGTNTLLYGGGNIVTTGSTLNISSSCSLNTSGITWNNFTCPSTSTIGLNSNLNVNGDVTLASGINQVITITFSGSGTVNTSLINTNLNLGNASFCSGCGILNSTITFTSGTTLNCKNLSLSSGGGSGVAFNTTTNNATINVNGNVTTYAVNQSVSLFGGTNTTINLISGGTFSMGLGSLGLGILTIPLNINSSGTRFFSGTIYYGTGTLTHVSGNTVTSGSTLYIPYSTTLNTSGMSWNNVTLNGTSTITLNSDLNLNGNLTTQTSPITINGTGSTVNVGGNLTINTTTSGTAPIVMNGTGSWTSNGSNLTNNLTFNTTGTTYVSGVVYYTTGTIRYVSGTTVTSGSTLASNSSLTLNTNTMVWNNVSFFTNSLVVTLTSNFNMTGTLTLTYTTFSSVSFVTSGNIFNPTGNLVVNSGSNGFTLTLPNSISINNATLGNAAGSFTLNSNTMNVGGNLTVQTTVGGSTNIIMNGTGTWSGNANGVLVNNLTFNTLGSITVSGSVSKYGGTITHTSGTMVTSGSTWNCSQTTTINTSGMTWNNVTIGGNAQTFTLSSDLNLSGNLSITATVGNTAFNGSTVNVGGSLTLVGGAGNFYSSLGTTSFVMNGTGTLTSSNLAGMTNNLTINTTGTVTITGTLYYSTGTFTYVNGNVISTGSLFYTSSLTTFNTAGMSLGSMFVSTTSTFTLLSDLSISEDFYNWFDVINFSGVGRLFIGRDVYLGNPNDVNNTTVLNLPNNIVVRNLYLRGHFLSGQPWGCTINNGSITVTNELNHATNDGTNVAYPCTGNGTIILKSQNGRIVGPTIGSGYHSVSTNLIIDGNFTITNYFAFSTRTLTGVSGRIRYTNAVSNFFIFTSTLNNIDKVLFDRITLVSSNTITMNKFFSGSPSIKTIITSDTTTNYNINFSDPTEKFSKFVKVSRATISRPNQLTILTNSGNPGNNVGIKFAPNQIPNGLPKNNSLVLTETVYGTNGLLTDPSLNLQ